jgi:putative mRNA 3-end processing factor
VTVSLHPAGHIIGSAQVRVERRGETWVVSGDYKTEADPTCAPFEPLRAHVFVTESTFGLPVYRWRPQHELFDEMLDWWRGNAASGRVSVLFAYSLGKAQRVLAGLALRAGGAGLPGELFTHGAVERMNDAVRASGRSLPPTVPVGSVADSARFRGGLVLAPPSASGSPWLRRFSPRSTAFASGWMRIRGARRRRGLDRGFALSDHVDWPALLAAIEATGAERVLVTHGYREAVVRHLRERGVDAAAIASAWEGESGESDLVPAAGAPPETAGPPAYEATGASATNEGGT